MVPVSTLGRASAVRGAPARGRWLRGRTDLSAMSQGILIRGAGRGEAMAEKGWRCMTAGRDVVIIGGGHNGLVAAAYLAKSGLRALVCERRDVLGGAAVSEHP